MPKKPEDKPITKITSCSHFQCYSCWYPLLHGNSKPKWYLVSQHLGIYPVLKSLLITNWH